MKLPTKNTVEISHFDAGKLIRQFRLKHGVSLRGLAIAMGYTAPFLSDLERGRRNWTQEKFILAEESIRKLSTPKKP